MGWIVNLHVRFHCCFCQIIARFIPKSFWIAFDQMIVCKYWNHIGFAPVARCIDIIGTHLHDVKYSDIKQYVSYVSACV